MAELNPIPKEIVDLLDRFELLKQSYEDLRAEMDMMNAELLKLREFKARAESDQIECHGAVHTAQSRMNERLDGRLTALEDLLALPEQPKPRQDSQRDVLRAILLEASGKWILAKTVRRKMNLDKDEFSRLLRVSKDFVEVKENPRNRRENLLKIS